MTIARRVNGPLALVVGSVVATAALLAKEHEALRVTGPGAVLFAVGCALCLAIRCTPAVGCGKGWRIARDLAEYVGLFGASAMVGAVASYPDAACTTGMADPLLVHADQMLHFNWVALYLLTSHHPALQLLGTVAYQSIYAIPAALLVQFAWSGKRAEAHRFLVAFWLAATMTLLLFRWLPAAGPLAELWKGPAPYMPQSALYQAHLIPLLQGHRLHIVDLDALHGLVSAPSFHAASGVLFILFARKMRRLRVPLIGLSLLMLAATPIEGTHYLIDIIAGGLVALLAYLATGLPQVRPLWDQQPRPRPIASLAPERERQHA